MALGDFLNFHLTEKHLESFLCLYTQVCNILFKAAQAIFLVMDIQVDCSIFFPIISSVSGNTLEQKLGHIIYFYGQIYPHIFHQFYKYKRILDLICIFLICLDSWSLFFSLIHKDAINLVQILPYFKTNQVDVELPVELNSREHLVLVPITPGGQNQNHEGHGR